MSDEVEQGGAMVVFGGPDTAVAGYDDVSASERGNTSAHVAGKNGGTLTPVRDAASAQRLVEAKRRKKAARIAEGVRNATKQIPDLPAGATVWDWYRYIAEQHALNAADPSARGSIQSLRWLDEALVPEPVKQAGAGDSLPAGGAALVLSPELVRDLLAELRARRSGEQGQA